MGKSKKIIIDANFPTEIRVALLDKNNNIEDVEYESQNKIQIKGNIYLAKITRIEPSLQAAFLDYGDEKSGFLPFNEIHSDYYQSLSSDKASEDLSLTEIFPPDVSEDFWDETEDNQSLILFDKDDVSLEEVAKMVSEQEALDFDLDATDTDVERFTISEKITPAGKNHRIHEVMKKGQIILVQATKEERGNKGASFTTFLSLAGKYCVLMPNTPLQNGVSRKIMHQEERRRLKDIISGLNPEKKSKSSIIARTAAIGKTMLDIKRDYDYLAKLWNKIRETTLKSKAPYFIHQEDGIALKTIRDMFDRNVKEILIQGDATYNICRKFMNDISPNAVSAIKEYKGKTPIFSKFNIEDQLTKMHQPIVNLPSGGYIVINPTEALTAIDVNSGKATSERNVEETAFKTNLEATKEIAKQSKLRDLSGLIVIDFIDMSDHTHRKIVERSFKEFLSKDKARIQTSAISSLGLLEMSRQRLRPSFLEINSNICIHCSGKGVVRADEPNAMLVLRTVENEIYSGNYDLVNLYANSNSILYLLNHKRVEISFIEEKYDIKLNLLIDNAANADNYYIEKIKTGKKADTVRKPALQDLSDIYIENSNESKKKTKPIAIKKEKPTEPVAQKLQDETPLAINNADINILIETDDTPIKAEQQEQAVPLDTATTNQRKTIRKKNYRRNTKNKKTLTDQKSPENSGEQTNSTAERSD